VHLQTCRRRFEYSPLSWRASTVSVGTSSSSSVSLLPTGSPVSCALRTAVHGTAKQGLVSNIGKRVQYEPTY
jgi:hypothetical protein